MAIFGKDSTTRQDGRAPLGEGTLSIIAAGMTITGDVESGGVVKVDGRIEGSVTGARQVLLGQGGTIRGNVVAEAIVIGGTVDGSVSARDRLELQSSAIVNGDIETRSIVVLEGAKINGVVRMRDLVGNAQPEPLRIAKGS